MYVISQPTTQSPRHDDSPAGRHTPTRRRASDGAFATAAIATAALLLLSTCVAADDVMGPINVHGIRSTDNDTHLARSSDGPSPVESTTPSLRRQLPGNGITQHGGPVMLGTTNVYYIWYGNWAGNSGVQILTDFMNNLGGSPWYNIITTYTSTTGVPIPNSLYLKGTTSVAYPYGTSLTDANIASVVSTAITTHALPLDANGVYFVLTSADVTASSGFCTSYCGWHTYITVSGVPVKFAFVGNAATQCPGACMAQSSGPNGNGGADGMVSVLAHELVETVSDPQLNAWYGVDLAHENGDLCAWTFGATHAAANGALANVKLGTREYLLQQNWVNANGGSCALSYNAPSSQYVMGNQGESCSQACQRNNMVCNPVIQTSNSTSLFTSLGVSCVADTR
jgi:Phosphate-induced protein 1 conserved region